MNEAQTRKQWEVVDFLANRPLAVAAMFCGTGKSRTMELHRFKYVSYTALVVILVPSLALMRQFRRADPTTTRGVDDPTTTLGAHFVEQRKKVKQWQRRQEGGPVVWQSIEDGCSSLDVSSEAPGTTDEAEIAARLETVRTIRCTYQSFPTLLKVMEKCGRTIDVLYCDEAHHLTEPLLADLFAPHVPFLASKETQRGGGSGRKRPLESILFPRPKQILLFTATPPVHWRQGAKGVMDEEEEESYNDDETSEPDETLNSNDELEPDDDNNTFDDNDNTPDDDDDNTPDDNDDDDKPDDSSTLCDLFTAVHTTTVEEWRDRCTPNIVDQQQPSEQQPPNVPFEQQPNQRFEPSNTTIPQDQESGLQGPAPAVVVYRYAEALRDGVLQDYEVRVDLSTRKEADDPQSLYNTIARAVYATGNDRVLTFHGSVAEEGDERAVLQFVNAEGQARMERAFREVYEREFALDPTVPGMRKVRLVGITASTPARVREEYFALFSSKTDEVVVLASCQTMEEGQDLTEASMVVYTYELNSYVGIVQRFGRVVRKKPHDRPATVLLNVVLDYEECQRAVGTPNDPSIGSCNDPSVGTPNDPCMDDTPNDREESDVESSMVDEWMETRMEEEVEVVERMSVSEKRQRDGVDISKVLEANAGAFRGIQTVLAALRCEDDELADEIQRSLVKKDTGRTSETPTIKTPTNPKPTTSKVKLQSSPEWMMEWRLMGVDVLATDVGKSIRSSVIRGSVRWLTAEDRWKRILLKSYDSKGPRSKGVSKEETNDYYWLSLKMKDEQWRQRIWSRFPEFMSNYGKTQDKIDEETFATIGSKSYGPKGPRCKGVTKEEYNDYAWLLRKMKDEQWRNRIRARFLEFAPNYGKSHFKNHEEIFVTIGSKSYDLKGPRRRGKGVSKEETNDYYWLGLKMQDEQWRNRIRTRFPEFMPNYDKSQAEIDEETFAKIGLKSYDPKGPRHRGKGVSKEEYNDYAWLLRKMKDEKWKQRIWVRFPEFMPNYGKSQAEIDEETFTTIGSKSYGQKGPRCEGVSKEETNDYYWLSRKMKDEQWRKRIWARFPEFIPNYGKTRAQVDEIWISNCDKPSGKLITACWNRSSTNRRLIRTKFPTFRPQESTDLLADYFQINDHIPTASPPKKQNKAGKWIQDTSHNALRNQAAGKEWQQRFRNDAKALKAAFPEPYQRHVTNLNRSQKYQAPNPEVKDEINRFLAEQPRPPGQVVLLDAEHCLSAYAIFGEQEEEATTNEDDEIPPNTLYSKWCEYPGEEAVAAYEREMAEFQQQSDDCSEVTGSCNSNGSLSSQPKGGAEGISPEPLGGAEGNVLCLCQSDPDTAKHMKEHHPQFRRAVFEGELKAYLSKAPPQSIALLYADFCGALTTAEEELVRLREVMVPGGLVAVTVSERGTAAHFTHETVPRLRRWVEEQVAVKEWLLRPMGEGEVPAEGWVYGGGSSTPMTTQIARLM